MLKIKKGIRLVSITFLENCRVEKKTDAQLAFNF